MQPQDAALGKRKSRLKASRAAVNNRWVVIVGFLGEQCQSRRPAPRDNLLARQGQVISVERNTTFAEPSRFIIQPKRIGIWLRYFDCPLQLREGGPTHR